jgi:tetratricopeptide (TPR) repeat protein
VWNAPQREALQVLADVYVHQEDPERAVILLEALRDHEPHRPEVLAALAHAYLRLGRFEDTLIAADAYLQLDVPPRDGAPIHLIRGRAAWGLGSSDEALRDVRRYLNLSRSER